jgi:predicted 2-oxoglutarate/Fe(II)-dependent dioxygenase YbiX
MENILDFIKVYKGAVSNELCDDIVNKYKDSDKFKLSETIGGLDTKIRNCYLLNLLDDEDIDGRLFKEQAININKYAEEFSNVSVEQDTGYGLLKYEGGEFSFFGKEHIIKASKGDVIMFPSNFVYRHEVLPVTKGTRYAIITWFK